jgi:hypothetical protein
MSGVQTEALRLLSEGSQSRVSAAIEQAYSASVVTISASNDNRKGLRLFNNSDADVVIAEGFTPTLTKFTVKIMPGAFYNMPDPVFLGDIKALWTSSATGTLTGTELS